MGELVDGEVDAELECDLGDDEIIEPDGSGGCDVDDDIGEEDSSEDTDGEDGVLQSLRELM